MMKNMLLSDYIIDIETSLIEAMKVINNNSRGVVYVTQEGKLEGVITDGDIRRFLLNEGNLNENVSAIMNKKTVFVELKQESNVNTLMQKYKISSIPVLDDDKKILKVYFDDKVVEREKEELGIPVVIMAGGKGTRLYPYTQILPKPLIPIGDKTITEHIMEHFLQYGCNRFAMIVNYKKHFIKSYFDDVENRLNVIFIEEKEFLGTGGGLKLLGNNINSTFFMTNCDILIEDDYSKILNFHKEHENIVTMVCAVKNMTIPYGTVDISAEGRALQLREKPQFSFMTNTGFYILEPEFIQMIPENKFIHITDVIQKCIDEGKSVGVYKIDEDKWLDMGQMEELERMKEKLNVK